MNINTGIEPILLECVGDELEHRSISTQTSNISLHQLFKDKMSKWCRLNWSFTCHVIVVMSHGSSYGGPKGQRSKVKFKLCWLMFFFLVLYLFIRWRIIYSFVLIKKVLWYLCFDWGNPDGKVGRVRTVREKYFKFVYSASQVGLIQEHFEAFQTNFMVFILSTLVSWMR